MRSCSECDAALKANSARGLCTACYARWRRNQPGRCRYCGGSMADEPGQTHARCLEDRRTRWAHYRDQIIDAYGAMCACCGEHERVFLSIDHVDGGGTAHRRSLGSGNRRLMLQIIAEGFPRAYRLLCFNCNIGRARNGGTCPHEHVLAIVGAS